ncbi:hypothetical protein M5K25_000104 [Dendrobium thyrsiflorum]|uniref:GATA-type domain-containing protein n=1 Tax=Dendrobium thyrsiflorum TaxID=117978 RepID=A0ABD0VSQ1_DENTH
MLCEDPFDSIDDLLDFKNYDDLLEMVDGCGNGGSVAPLQAPAITGGIHGRPAANIDEQISSEDDALSMCNDIEIINSDWLSNFLEDSELNFFNAIEFGLQSPISVLETNIASTSSTPNPHMTQTRTKRPRAQVTRPISPSLTRWAPEPEITEKRRKSNAVDCNMARKCMHCESQKTPQWRAGPMGPKTLCNACGVRYKSGRLFPEYRPAESPSFTPSVHSNSHKKVVEMRQLRANLSSSEDNVGAKNCDLLNYIRNK